MEKNRVQNLFLLFCFIVILLGFLIGEYKSLLGNSRGRDAIVLCMGIGGNEGIFLHIA
jgi:hypothetical protein